MIMTTAHGVPCPDCGEDNWTECDEDYGSLGDGGSYVRYRCLNCNHTTDWVMLPD